MTGRPRRTLLSALVRWAVGCLSRATNAVRLHNLPPHRQRVRRSRAVLRELRAMRGEAVPARPFSYLRQVDPLVYEEVVLSALEDAGAFVLRNRRYSGDGGVDTLLRLLIDRQMPQGARTKALRLESERPEQRRSAAASPARPGTSRGGLANPLQRPGPR